MPRLQGTKRKGTRQEPDNIKRWRKDLDTFTEGRMFEGVTDHADDGRKTTQTKSKAASLSRKERRKEGRKLKKMRNLAFSQHTKLPSAESLEKERQDKIKQKETRKKKLEKRKRQRENRRARILEEKEEANKKKEAEQKAVEQDEKAIKQLEKQMKMNKRKSKNLPQSFINDGLDFILDAVDGEKLKCFMDNEEQIEELTGPLIESGSEDDSDIDEPKSFEESYDEVSGEEREEEEVPVIESQSPATNMISILKKKGNTKYKKVRFGVDDENEEEEEEENITRVKKNSSNKKDIVSFLKQSIAEIKAEKKEKIEITGDNGNMDEASDEEEEEMDSEDEVEDEMMEEDEEEEEEEGDSDVGEEEEEDSEGEEVREEEDKDNDHDGEENDSESEEGSQNGQVKSEKEEKEPNYKEDIYGRLRDKEGNIVTEKKALGAYIPPGKRLEMAKTQDAKKKLELERTKKQIKGLINRLSEGNVQSIGSQIEDMFRSRSRAELSEILAETINEACVSISLIPERLISEQMLLVAMLHMNVGNEVGALFLQNIVERFNSLYNEGGNYGDGKEMDNILVMLGNMYNFKIFQSVLIFDVLKKLTESFAERDIELLLVLLRNVGFSLRKDDPAGLKEIILKVQEKASSVDTSQFIDESRVKFMLEVLMAIKNNNMRKIPNFDPTHVEHLRKILRNHCKGSSLMEEQLRITLHDLLDVETKGRWWLVGSAWSGREDKNPETTLETPESTGYSDKILELARKQRMNTDVRKNIFCIVMTCEDFVDAFEKLLKLNLKNQQEREIIHVLIDVCLQEKSINPFYAYLVQKFCEFHRRFQMTVQFNFWDRMKMLYEMTTQSIKNLAAFMTHLLVTKAMSISVLKTVEFSELDKHKLLLIRSILKALLLNYPEHIVVEVFGRVAPFPQLANLREALRVFMRHFILNKMKGKEGNNELEPRIELAEEALGALNKPGVPTMGKLSSRLIG